MPTDRNLLDRNLARLRLTEPDLADRLRQTPPTPLRWTASRAGPLSATVEHDGRSRQLASRYDPLAEAQKLTDAVDWAQHAAVFVLGMGLGYHVCRLAQRMKDQSLLVVYEPDTPLIRAVLERIDHTDWLGRPHVLLLDGEIDRAALLGRLEKFTSLLTMGTKLLSHPPSRQLHTQAMDRFGQAVTQVLSYCRTNVATTMVNASRTHANLTANLSHYVAGPTTDELHQAAHGYPAVCVGAGPSLARNVDLLTDPAVRSNLILITAQTTLKPLLDRGIEPDFVTALDYHEISKRFYEDLPDLPRVTLVAEPLAHPMILDHFPGPIRVTNHRFLDVLLGDSARPRVPVPYGATVAHLSFYLAQHLGCDPIILIGQDLGFSDGLYYCPGTAIHQVWAPELGPFNTLEMLEWQRIVRHRGMLRRCRDIHDRPIYSDEQMQTYLKQFERDFAKAPQTVIDATEGGLPKPHTTPTTLAQALADHATRPVPPPPLPPRRLDTPRLASAQGILQTRMQEVSTLRSLSRKTTDLIHQMLEHQRDTPRMNELFDRLTKYKRRVDRLSQTFQLVNELNAVGTFKRARADRIILNSPANDPLARQRQQLERDLVNLDWLVQSCDEVMNIFRQAKHRLEHTLAQSRRADARPAVSPAQDQRRSAPIAAG